MGRVKYALNNKKTGRMNLYLGEYTPLKRSANTKKLNIFKDK